MFIPCSLGAKAPGIKPLVCVVFLSGSVVGVGFVQCGGGFSEQQYDFHGQLHARSPRRRLDRCQRLG